MEWVENSLMKMRENSNAKSPAKKYGIQIQSGHQEEICLHSDIQISVVSDR